MRLTMFAAVLAMAVVGCGGTMGTSGSGDGTGAQGGTGQAGTAGTAGTTGATGPAGPIGPHIVVKDAKGNVLGIPVESRSSSTPIGITILTYHSTVPGLVDGYLLNSIETVVYNVSSQLVLQEDPDVTNRLAWSPHYGAVGHLYKAGALFPGVVNEYCAYGQPCVAGSFSPPGTVHSAVDTGMVYDVYANLPWSLGVE